MTPTEELTEANASDAGVSEVQGWQPIVTAPKGELLLLWCLKGVPDRPGYQPAGFELTFGWFVAGERQEAQWLSVEERTEYHDYGGMTGMSVWTESLVCAPTH